MRFLLSASALLFAFAAAPAALAEAGETDAAPLPGWEAEPELDAAALVEPALLSGPGWQVLPKAQVTGYQARFTIRTDYGEIPAESVEMLALRIAEMPAVQALHAESVTKVIGAASLDAAADTGRALARIARHPIATVTALPRGVARYFGKKLKKLDERFTRLGDRAHRSIAEDGNPYSDAQGPMTATRTETPEERAWYEKPARETLRLVKSELGYNRAKRELAQSLGLDPSTSNPLLRPRLDALAWAGSGGRKLGGLALGAAGPVADQAVSVGGRIDEAVWALDPEDLRARNDEILAEHCADETQRRAFLRQRAFTPTLQTALADLVRELAPSEGCEALLDLALIAGSEVEARFVLNALRLAQAYLGADAARGLALVPIGSAPALRGANGEWLLPLPLDYLCWTQEIETFFDELPRPDGERTVLVSGEISLRAQRELTDRGYSLVPHLRYPGGPPYAASPVAP